MSLSLSSAFDAAFIDALAEAVAAKIATRSAVPVRVYRAEAKQHGAPSWRWLEERASEGLIVLRGPRGARYVDRVELDALLATTTIRRVKAPKAPASGDMDADARAAVAELVAKRGAK